MTILYMKNYMCVFSLLVLCSCANIVAPSGGPKDLTPPTLIQAIPPNQSINFKGNEITLVLSIT